MRLGKNVGMRTNREFYSVKVEKDKVIPFWHAEKAKNIDGTNLTLDNTRKTGESAFRTKEKSAAFQF
jgi:hypothetical protein